MMFDLEAFKLTDREADSSTTNNNANSSCGISYWITIFLLKLSDYGHEWMALPKEKMSQVFMAK